MRKFVSRPREDQPRLVSGAGDGGRGPAVKETQGNVPSLELAAQPETREYRWSPGRKQLR